MNLTSISVVMDEILAVLLVAGILEPCHFERSSNRLRRSADDTTFALNSVQSTIPRMITSSH